MTNVNFGLKPIYFTATQCLYHYIPKLSRVTDIGTYQATTPRSSGGHFKGQGLRHHGPPELHGLVVVEQVGGGRVVVQGGRSRWSVGS